MLGHVRTQRGQIRLLFLLHKYNTPMDYGDDAMSGALAAEKIFSEFFHNVKAALRRTTARVRKQEMMGMFCR